MKESWLILVSALYLLACFLPEVKGVSPPGYFYLLNLPIALFVPAWWVNPLFFAGWMALANGKVKLAGRLGVVATFLASTFFIMLSQGRGGPGPHVSIFSAPGVDCWLLSMVALAGSVFLKEKEMAGPEEKPDRVDDL